MHELGIMTGVMDSVCPAARQANATKVLSVTLAVGEMTEAIEDALVFAFEALCELEEYSLCKDAKLEIRTIRPRSICLECGTEYEHDRFTLLCPHCQGFDTKLLAGRELQIESIEVDIPDDDDQPGEGA